MRCNATQFIYIYNYIDCIQVHGFYFETPTVHIELNNMALSFIITEIIRTLGTDTERHVNYVQSA